MQLEELDAMLVSFSDGIESRAVGLLDLERNEITAASTQPVSAFWQAFHGLGCLGLQWATWYGTLRAEKMSGVDCTCGRHVALSFLIHERWVMIVLTSGPIVARGEDVIAKVLRILTQVLPRGGARPDGQPPPHNSGGSSGPAELGIPIWWARRRTDS